MLRESTQDDAFSAVSVSSIQADKICSALLSHTWLFLNSLKVQAATGIFSMANLLTGVSKQIAAEKFTFFILCLLDFLHISSSLGGLIFSLVWQCSV